MTDPAVRPGASARELLARHERLVAGAAAVLGDVDDTRARVVQIATDWRETQLRTELAQVDVERLGDLTEKNLRTSALRAAGYRRAIDLLDVDAAVLDAAPGVGPTTARAVAAAVAQLAQVVRDSTRIRIRLDREDASGTELLGLLHRLERLAPAVEEQRTGLTDYVTLAGRAVADARPAARRLGLVLRGRRTRDRARGALAALADWDAWASRGRLGEVLDRLGAAAAAPGPGPLALWDDFERRAASYYAVLGQIVPVGGTDGAEGMLPTDLVERIEARPLDQRLLHVNLRGYQAFGARFALNQGRCMIGDEMGLGKTVQAIAAMADRAAEAPGARFLVVCPASVLINWLREVPVHSALVPHRLHGPDREKATARWLAQGGVGVTTFGSLHHVPLPQEQGGGVEMLVVDEAHLVKNPRAQRSRTVAAWSEACWRVLFLTGTPLENRLEEFVALVRLLQPEVVAELPRHLGLAGADAFRARMAPVYLRRNQVDVLVELPELVAVQDWEELGPAGELVYLPAVRAGQFMAMRRAAFATADPRDSTKLERLREIVAEARSNGHRVVVFSYFRDVLATVAQALTDDGAPVHGPITGSVPADQRQALVDAFSVAAPGAALVAQVQAGGVGINVQAASVVVLCEPQLKPTAEAQAIARVHRMGQVRTVQVHRLLVEDSVDERILELLGTKERLFDEYVRDSALAQSAVAAVDVTEARLARDVVAAEQARLGYGPVWDELEGEH